MTDKLKKLLTFKKKPKVGLFIDNANWFYPQKELGWKISYSHLRSFLGQFFSLKTIVVYAGTPLDEIDRVKFNAFCEILKKEEFEINLNINAILMWKLLLM